MKFHEALIPVAVLSLTAAHALGQGSPPDYGLTWRTVGDPGNPAARAEDYTFMSWFGVSQVGAVNYTYRLTQTEATNSQWLEFVDAYSRVNPSFDLINDWAFTGSYIQYQSSNPAHYGWYILPGTEQWPTEMSWFYAARFVNWLQNGKAMTLSAFETGAYNLGSFYEDPPNSGDFHGQSTRAPGAQYWIPNWDELAKGLHWDPNKNGPGQGGYWMYPDSSDTEPVGGLPGTPGAQTSAGNYPNPPYFVPAGSYPNSQSPWGLLDGSGGVREYMEGWDGLAADLGTRTGQSDVYPTDRLDWGGGGGPAFVPVAGLRIASAVPTPGASVALGIIGSSALFRRRRPAKGGFPRA